MNTDDNAGVSPKQLLLRSALVFIVARLLAATALAHQPFETSAVARLQHGRLEITLTLSSAATLLLLGDPEIGAFDQAAFEKFRPQLLARAPSLFTVTAGGAPLPLERSDVKLAPGGEAAYSLIYPNPDKTPLRLDAVFLRQLKRGFISSLAVFDDEELQLGSKLLTAESTALDIPLNAPAGVASPVAPAAVPAASPVNPAPSFAEFLRLGIEHILTGYDHLLFLCGLLVACRRLRAMLAVVTFFTLAHSVTLALAALNVVQVSSRIVEPLIAASIVFVGLENLFLGENSRGRAAVAFGFGFIHGFGFAGALRETGLGTTGRSLIVPLFSFNLGVEIGQLAVAAVFVPLLWQMRKIPFFARYGTSALSVIVVIIGGYWLLMRTFFA